MQQRKLPSTIQVSLLKYSVMFLLSYGPLSLQFPSLTTLTIVANGCKEHIKCVQLLTL